MSEADARAVVGKSGMGWPVAIGLVATGGLGVVLRWSLTGRGMVVGDFGPVRSAHSHLAYYGVLFPIVWRAWARRGEPIPARHVLVGYVAATLMATVDFAVRGYALISIAGSAVVLAVWIVSAWPFRGRLLGCDWMAAAVPAVVGSAGAIPVVDVLTKRGDPSATAWVHAFLAWLLLGVGARTALRQVGAPSPPGWLHAASVLGAGLALGPFPVLPLRGLLLLEGILLILAGWWGRDGWDLRVAWVMAGFGLAGVSTGWIPWSAPMAVAGVHFLALGPILAGLEWPVAWRPWRAPYLAMVAVFNAFIVLTGLNDLADWAGCAAFAGTCVAGTWLAVVVHGIREQGTPGPGRNAAD